MTAPRDAIGLSERLRTPIWNEDTMKQWDSWRRMIAEMRGASLPRDCFESFLDGIDEERAEAATALDALQARVKELEAADRYANLISIIADIRERSGLGGYPMLSELADAIGSKLADAESRATSAEQQRDEALERAAKVAEQFGEPYALNTNTGAMMFRAVTEKIVAAIRRLAAGTEKEGE